MGETNNKYSSTLTVVQITEALTKANNIAISTTYPQTISADDWTDANGSGYKYEISNLVWWSALYPDVIFYSDGNVYDINYTVDNTNNKIILYSNVKISGYIVVRYLKEDT